jgi:hypothetical protein
MSIAAAIVDWFRQRPAALIWAIALVIVAAVVAARPSSRTVYICFATAGRSWLESSDCYADLPEPWGGYRYSPAVSVFMVPFGLLPDRVGAVLWRLLGAAMVIGGFAYGCRMIDASFRERSNVERQWLWLLLLPLTVGNLYNGQANPHLTGLCLIGVAAAIGGRWTLAAIALAAACYIKAYPISLALLVTVVAPGRFGRRFALAMIAGALLPFAAQSPDYAFWQYRSWFDVLAADNRFHPTLGTSYRDLSQLMNNVGIPMTRGGFLAVQGLTAAMLGMFVMKLRWKRGWDETRSLQFCYFAGTFWMLLCGPATESSTYVLLAPAAVWLAVDAFQGRIAGVSRWCILMGFASVHLALISSAFPFGGVVHGWGLHPLGALLLLVGFSTTPVVWEHVRQCVRIDTLTNVPPQELDYQRTL